MLNEQTQNTNLPVGVKLWNRADEYYFQSLMFALRYEIQFLGEKSRRKIICQNSVEFSHSTGWLREAFFLQAQDTLEKCVFEKKPASTFSFCLCGNLHENFSTFYSRETP